MTASMNYVTLVQGILDQVLPTADFRPLWDHLADDVAFEVTIPDGTPGRCGGKQAVIDYFTNLGDIVTFWQVKVFGSGERVVVLGDENYTIGNSGVAIRSEFALMLNVCDGRITRLLIIEDLPGFDAEPGAIGADFQVPAYS